MKRIVGMFLVIIGFLFSLNAVMSGPHAFGSGLLGVVVLVLIGVIWMVLGSWTIWKDARRGTHRKEKVTAKCGDNGRCGE